MKYVFSIIAVVVIVLLARRKLIVYNRGAITNKPVFGGSITTEQVGDIAFDFLNKAKNWIKKTVEENVQSIETEWYLTPRVNLGIEDHYGFPVYSGGDLAQRQKIIDTPTTKYYWENTLTRSKVETTAGSVIPPTIPKP